MSTETTDRNEIVQSLVDAFTTGEHRGKNPQFGSYRTKSTDFHTEEPRPPVIYAANPDVADVRGIVREFVCKTTGMEYEGPNASHNQLLDDATRETQMQLIERMDWHQSEARPEGTGLK